MKTFALLLTLPLILFAKYEDVQDTCRLEIITPTLKLQKTAKIKLQNGLEVFLISDPDAKQSAVAYLQKVGQWHDGAHPGTAHFLEHLLFLGSQAYPEEDGLMTFVKENGGAPNAYTALDHTVYLYSVNHDAFNESINQLSSFFIDPLLSQGSIDRELNAVEQEHQMGVENDMNRMFQVFKAVANQNHPNAQFGCGNKETLSQIPHGVVREWFETYYGAKNAHLVIYSNQSLEDLKVLVDDKFSPIRHDCKTPPIAPEIIGTKAKGNMVYIKPIKDLKYLQIFWEMPQDISRDLDYQTTHLLSQGLNRESEKSLFEQLKREGLIQDGGFYFHRYSANHMLATLGFQLTEEGVKNLQAVQERGYQALAGLKETGIPPYIFEETNRLLDIEYKFQKRTEALSVVSKHVEGLLHEPLESYPQKSATISRYSPSKIRETLSLLTPENALTFVIAPEELVSVKFDQKEPWAGVEYTVIPIEDKELAHLASLPPHQNIALAPPNPYLPENFDLKTVFDDRLTLLSDSPEGIAYYSPESHYQVPEVSSIICIHTPQLTQDVRSQVLSSLYTQLASYINAPFFSKISQGGCSASVSKHKLSFIIMLSGFNDKSEQILLDTVDLMKNLRPTKEQFESQKQELLTAYQNQQFDRPLQQAFLLSHHTFHNYYHLPEQSIEALNKVSYEDFLTYTEKLFDQAYLKGLFTGNLSKLEAKHQWRSLTKSIVHETYPVRDHAIASSLLVPNQGGPFKLNRQIPMQGGAALLTIQQGFHTFEKEASQQVLGKALSSDFFQELRTNQQTGYAVMAKAQESESQLSQIFLAQSTTHTPQELLTRFEIFIENFVKKLDETVSEGRFDQLKAALLEELSQPQPNLQQKSYELFTYFVDKNGDFRFKEQQIGALKQLTYEQFKKDTQAFISRDNGRRIAFLLEGSKNETAFHYNDISLETIKDQGTYISCAEK